jgi:putative ABC transport system permease protein
VLISDGLWRRRFNGDPSAVGRRITINNQAREIVGVLPPQFRVHLPPSIGAPEQIDVWFSTAIDTSRQSRGYGVIARLSKEATLEDAQRELDALVRQLAAEHPSMYRDASLVMRPRRVHEALTAGVGPGLRALAWAVGFVLMVSCVNVANLLLVRGTARSRELAIRRALGASRTRIAAQLLVESLLLAVAGSAAGVQLARWGIAAVDWLRPVHLPRQSQIAMDTSVAAFAVLLTVGTAIVFGLLPALRLSGRDLQPARAGRGDTAGRAARRLHRTLVVAEIACSIVPLVAAALMVRSFVNLTHAPLGFEARGVLTAFMPLSFRGRFAEVPARIDLHREAFARLRALPHVEQVSGGSPVPFGPLQFTRRYGRVGEAAPAALTTMQSVFPGYLGVVGTRLLHGRDFTGQDLAEQRRVVIVDVRIARALWPDGALGQTLALANEQRVNEFEVIGVTEPVRVRAVRDDTTPHVFLPYHAFPVEMALVLRTGAADDIAPAIRRTVAALGTGRAVEVRALEEFVGGSIAETRFVMLVLGGFALAGIALAAIGLYGTLAYLTTQRAREFGIRMALGARRAQVVALVTGESAALTLTGMVVGAAAALAVLRTMRGLFFDVLPADGATFAGVLGVVVCVALIASIRPAWSAGRIDPVRALRSE